MARRYLTSEPQRSAAMLLKVNHGRVPLDCTEGPIRNKLGESADIRALECALIRATPLSQMFTNNPEAVTGDLLP